MPLPLIPQDKANHACYGALIFVITYVLTAFQRLPALEISGGMVLLLAIGKEVYDRANRNKNTPDLMDVAATIAGGALCAIPLFV